MTFPDFDFEKGEILLIDKPLEWTSFDVVNKVRYAVSKKHAKRMKVGHAGTLDPLATGLLIICTGKKTKEIDLYQAQEKEYTGKIHLGQTTPSYDKETEPDKEFPTGHISNELIYEAAKKFIGEIEQIPPIFSAVKVDGKRLYKHARKGQDVEIKSRQIFISEFEITHIEMPLVSFRVVCSKGTYIRSLAYDFGKALNSGGHLAELRRTRIGDFRIDNAYELNALIEFIRAGIEN